MALKTDLYLFPLINKFRDAFAEAFSYAKRDGLNLNETITRLDANGAEVTFSVVNWRFNTPNTWCGVPFDVRMVDTIRGSRNTYECYFRKSHDEGSSEYNYTVECLTLKNEEAPMVPVSVFTEDGLDDDLLTMASTPIPTTSEDMGGETEETDTETLAS